MLIRTAVGATLMGLGLSLTSFSSARALTSHECSVKYQEAQKANTLNGMKYADFRKAQCGSEAAAPAAAPTAAAAAPTAAPANPLKPTPTAAPVAPVAPKPTTTAAPVAPAAPVAATNAVFPSAISPKYSSESAGRGREHTCLDQYNVNKTSNGNGGLKWIQKGGGYYSQCNNKLKGA